jgi:hypothetical protein
MNEGFNGNFYVATATVIPILYIALIAQFPSIERIVTNLSERTARLTKDYVQPVGGSRRSSKARTALAAIQIGYVATFLIAVFIIWASVQAELQSIIALYHQSSFNPAGILRAVIILVTASLLVPVWTLFKAYLRLFRSGRKRSVMKSPPL